MQRNKNTVISLNFLKAMSGLGYGIFNLRKARELGLEYRINPN